MPHGNFALFYDGIPFGDTDLLSVGINDKAPIGGANAHDLLNRGGSLDQYYFQPSRSFQLSVTGRF